MLTDRNGRDAAQNPPVVRHVISANDLRDDDLTRMVTRAAESSAGRVRSGDQPPGPVAGIHFLKTSRRRTTGASEPDPGGREVFAPFRVTSALWDHSPDAVLTHDLPAHRGEDVTAEVLDGPHSPAFDRAENKRYATMSVPEWCAGRNQPTGQ